MPRPHDPELSLRTLAVVAWVAGIPWISACDKNGDDSTDSADGAEDGNADDGGTGGDLTQCERNPQGDTYAVGLSKEGEQIKVMFLDADPAPPARGLNRWDMMISAVDDMPLTDADLSVSPFMPAHNHGSPTEVEITAGEMDGEYLLDKVDLFMAGLWEVTIAVQMDESTQDSVTFEFCIDP